MPGAGNKKLPVVKPLKRLLGGATVTMLICATAFLARDVALGSGYATLGLALLVGGLGVAATVLLMAKDLSLLQLRIVELATFGAVAGYLATSSYLAISEQLAQGEAALALSRWHLALSLFVLLMVAYGTVVPNAPTRAATVIGAMALTPLGLGMALRALNPDYSAVIQVLITPGRIIDSFAIVVAGAGVAILGAYLMDQYFSAAHEAKKTSIYTLKERIGEGGMGEVWLAEHTALARPAAVKLIKRGAVGDGDEHKSMIPIRRFEREARATAKLRSPHTIEIYDFGVTGDGTFYYAMEHLNGMDLGELVERHGPLPPGRVTYLLMQACESLADAHNNSMTHRDIKPANIYTCRMGGAHDFVKVLDFGLVKTEPRTDSATKLTVEGVTSGTPAYMAPEMAIAQNEVDGRVDIYALGCVGYFLLTGQQVFDGETAVSIILEHVRTQPVPPSQRVECEIPASLERSIMKCLEKDPADRFQTAKELGAELAAGSLRTAGVPAVPRNGGRSTSRNEPPEAPRNQVPPPWRSTSSAGSMVYFLALRTSGSSPESLHGLSR